MNCMATCFFFFLTLTRPGLGGVQREDNVSGNYNYKIRYKRWSFLSAFDNK